MRAKRAVALSAAVAGALWGIVPARGADMTFNISLVGSLNPLTTGPGTTNNWYADLWAEGDLVVMGSVSSTSTGGVTIINNANPATPVMVGRYVPPGENGQFRDVLIRNGIGYFALDSHLSPAQGDLGVHIVNLANPATPTKVYEINVPQNGFAKSHDLFIDGNFLYIASNATYNIKVFNISNPAAPTYVRDIITSGFSTDNTHDMTIKNGRMYTSNLDNGWTDIFDVTNIGTQAPVKLGSLNIGGDLRNHSTWPSEDGNLLAVARESTNGEVQLWNIANPAAPSLITSIHAAAYGIDSYSAHNPIIIGDTLYVSWYQAGLQIFNIRNPSAPVHLGAYDTFVGGFGNPGSFANFDGNWGLDVFHGNNKILLSDFDNGFFTVDATNAFKQMWTYAADNGKWQESARWDSGAGPIPNSSEMIASFTHAGAGTMRTLTVDGALTPAKPRVASMQFHAALGYTIQSSGGGEIELKSSSGPAQITMAEAAGTKRPTSINVPIDLQDDLIVTNDAGATSTPNLNLGVIKATNRNITFAGTGVTALTAANPNLSGSITVNGGTLQISADNQLGNLANTITLNVGILKTGAAITSNRTLVVGPGGGLIDTNGFNSTFGDLEASGHAFTKSGAGNLGVNRLHASFLEVIQGVLAVAPGGTDASAVFLESMFIEPAAALDLADNDLVVRFGSFTEMRAQVIAGFGAMAGITSSTSDGTQILALFDNAQVGAADWLGIPIAPSAIVGKYTYFGDVNLDGQVSGDDYAVVDSNLDTDPPEGLEWLSGDANLDGLVTGDDYATIDSNLGLGNGNPLSSSADFGELSSSLSLREGSRAVPEPVAGAGLLVAALLARRQRRQPTCAV